MPAKVTRYDPANFVTCEICGKSEGMGWWVGRGDGYASSRSAVARCHPCYLARVRELYYARTGGKPRQSRPKLPRVLKPKAAWACEVCGVDRLTQMPGRFCSNRCRMKARNAARPRVERVPRQRKAPSSPVRYRTCKRCNGVMVDRNGVRYCGDECRRLQNIDKVMGLYRKAFEAADVKVAMVWRRKLVDYLVDRDGNRCALCAKTIDITLKSGPRGDERGVSIDHIVPRSKGGSDDLANLRLAHWSCNRQRGNRGEPEQLALVG